MTPEDRFSNVPTFANMKMPARPMSWELLMLQKKISDEQTQHHAEQTKEHGNEGSNTPRLGAVHFSASLSRLLYKARIRLAWHILDSGKLDWSYISFSNGQA